MPRLRAPARCSFSSSVRPSVASCATVHRLRLRRSRYGRDQNIPNTNCAASPKNSGASFCAGSSRPPADQKLRQVHLALGAAHEADHDEPPAGRERGQVVREIGGDDVVEDDVDAAPAGELAGPRAEVLAAVVDGGRRAERHALPALLVAAGGDEAGVAGLAAEKDRRRAHAAPAAVHERRLAGGERAQTRHEEVREGGQEDLGEGARLLVAYRLGHREGRAVVDHRLLGVAATGKERHDPLAGPEAARLGAHLQHLAGTHEPQDRRGAGRRRVEPLALEEIGAVDRRGAYADAEVGRAEGGGGRLAHLEHRLVARLPDHDRAHAGPLTTVRPSESMRRRLDLPGGATYPSGQRMSVFVLLVAVVLAVALWRLAARLRDLDRQVRELRLLHREIEELRGDLDRGLGVTRAHLAAVAAGEPPERDVILRSE